MIIFGLAVFYFGAKAQGAFHCPNCGGDRAYKLKIGRRWFTLFFVPVIYVLIARDHRAAQPIAEPQPFAAPVRHAAGEGKT